MAGDEFQVEVKASAIDRNSAVAELVASAGERLSYGGEGDARADAAELTRRGESPVRIQAVAPQDDTDADAYLVAGSRTRGSIPAAAPDDGWQFGVDASQYGALGEALLTAGDGTARPLALYVRHDLELDPETSLSIDVDESPPAVTKPGTPGRWQPDCALSVDIAGRTVARYRCEIKTGGGSLERSQRELIEYAARETPVIYARVDVSGLPREYEVSFEQFGETSRDTPTDAAQRSLEDWSEPEDE
ncbi:hypothetical protein ACOZ4N_15560 [Halorientalis pallida]|uniref:hypothetical protein n=1 Tax=Halorientalis pallida TaxID=2479928 RepID=UPI003C70572F